ncbi:MAG: lipid-A-disaccharide synthase [Flavobacteriales bacterium]|nr:lipid-A-disaccharide synthase [Flavobacteriales bacterium]
MSGTKRIYIIAGEASGDLHGGNLVRELFACAASDGVRLEVRAWGGDHMQRAGASLVKHIRDLAFMGFTEVLLNLGTILRNMAFCKRDIASWQPDALILIDYPGFNLRMAEYAHGLGIPVHYYISPQLWAWKAGRVEIVRRAVDHMYVILPFEKEWYAERGVVVEFVGHPLLDALTQDQQPAEAWDRGTDPRPVVALLPGSRRQEIARMLPVMLRMAPLFRSHRFVVAAAPGIPEAFYTRWMPGAEVERVSGRTYALLRASAAALVTSGTATLETALLGIPQVVCYKGGGLSVWIARRVVKVAYISLVNLILGREAVKELVQEDFTERNLQGALDRILNQPDVREGMATDMAELRTRSGGGGASRKVADRVWKSLGSGR